MNIKIKNIETALQNFYLDSLNTAYFNVENYKVYSRLLIKRGEGGPKKRVCYSCTNTTTDIYSKIMTTEVFHSSVFH